jgi:hypothetical protein
VDLEDSAVLVVRVDLARAARVAKADLHWVAPAVLLEAAGKAAWDPDRDKGRADSVDLVAKVDPAGPVDLSRAETWSAR